MTYYEEYRYNLAQYLKQKPSELIKRDKRIDESLITYDTYVDLVNQQRVTNPDYPFYHEGIRLKESSRLPIPIVSSVINQERFTYSGVKEVTDIIYKDTDYFNRESVLDSTNLITNQFLFQDSEGSYNAELYEDIPSTEPRLVWEFYKESPSFINTRYLYLPIRDNYLQQVNELLPNIPMWDVNELDAWREYPNKEYLLDTTSEQWPTYYNVLSNDLKHAFLPNFLFTGRVVLQGYEGNLLYEYTDIQGVYGLKDELYLSNLKPANLDFPIGVPRTNEIENDECYQHLIGYYPERGDLITQVGKFTGYITNNKYHPYKTYYLYERFDNTVFLSEYRPHSYALDFINIAARILEVYKEELILIGKEIQPDYIGVDDLNSCGLLFSIEDSLCVPKEYEQVHLDELFSDCTYIDDNYDLPIDLKIFNDDLMVNDFLILGDCSGEDPINNCLFNNVNYINDRFQVIDCSPK